MKKGVNDFYVAEELRKLEVYQARLVRFNKYLEMQERADGSTRYNDLQVKLSCVIGTIEDVLSLEI